MYAMVDIETLGTQPGCQIVSIGAVQFTRRAVLDEELYVSVDPNNCEKHGLTTDPSTVAWWAKQSREARKQLEGGEPLTKALGDLNRWLRRTHAKIVWANAPTFDCSILRACYEAVDMEPAWKYWDERCHRTLKKLGKPKVPRAGTHHNAVDDARHQAHEAVQAFKNLGIS